jgi:K+-sensing histidine kinase KdpD
MVNFGDEQATQMQRCNENRPLVPLPRFPSDHDDCRQELRYLCHDITISVATVSVLAETACAESGIPVPVAKWLRQITSEAQHIAAMCGYVLEQPQDADVVRLDLVASKALASARMAHATAIELRAVPAIFLGHTMSIWRLITNLVDNACRAAGPRGTVRVVVGVNDEDVYLDVADSGSDSQVTRTEVGSTGRSRPALGLHIVDGIVKEHLGWMQVGQSDLGGTRLLISFPSLGIYARTDGDLSVVDKRGGHEDRDL